MVFIFLAWVNFVHLLLQNVFQHSVLTGIIFDILTSSTLLLIFYLMFLKFLISYFLLTQSNCVVLNLNILLYNFLLLLYNLLYNFLFIQQYTNLQNHLNSFMCFYGFLLCKILEILQFFQYTKSYWAMENVGIALFCRIYVLAAIITLRFLILEILCGDGSLISVFHFLCKTIVPIYYSVYLPFLLSKKILSCSLWFIKFLILWTLRLIIFISYIFILPCSFVFVICVFDF